MNALILHIRFILLFYFLALLSAQSNARNFNANVNTNISSNITISERDEIIFGTIAVDPAGDDITLATNNGISIANGSQHLGGQQYGVFRITGTPNTSVNYTFSTGDTLSGPGSPIPLDSFTTNRSNPFTITGSGRRDIRIGATIHPSAGQLGGSYTGTYTFTVNYQ